MLPPVAPAYVPTTPPQGGGCRDYGGASKGHGEAHTSLTQYGRARIDAGGGSRYTERGGNQASA